MGKRVTGILSLAMGILLIGATLALASDVATSVADATAPTGAVSLAPGASGQIQITFTISGSQAQTCTFQAYKDWTLSGGSFTGANPQTFSASGPRTGQTAAQVIGPISGTVTIAATQAPQAAPFTLAVAAFDVQCPNQTGSKLAVGAASNYAVTVTAPSDSTPPVITPNVSGLLGSHGWYVGDVALSWSVTDGQSSIASSTGCGATTIDTDTNGTIFTCQATSGGGTASSSITIKRDATPPTMTASLDPAANDAGWNNTAVGVTFSCDDGVGSGIDPDYGCPGPESLTADGHYSLHESTADMAGNVITPTFLVDIDQELPTISGSALPAANGNGWRNEAVTVHFDCSDTRSGIASCTADTSLSGEGADQSAAGTAVDNAGNQASTTVGDIDIDLTEPGISFVGPLPSGWSKDPLTLTWNCADGLSGPASPTTSATLDEGEGQQATGTCADLAGNTASDTQTGYDVDLTPPEITFASRTQANGNAWNDGPVSVTWTCTDELSGVLEDSVMTVVTTDGANQTASGTCEDLAGNTASADETGINIDTVDPTITGQATPPANANGWNNTDVEVSFSCQDDLGGSGIATDSVQGDTLTDEGAGQSVTSAGECIDRAGNAAAAKTVLGISIDETAPVITGHASPAPNLAGWNNSDVTVTFACADAGGSGVDQDDVTGATLTGEGSALHVTSTGTCIDRAGNPAVAATVSGIKIDRSAPAITDAGPTASADGTNGWYTKAVTNTFEADGDVSGLADPSKANFTVSSGSAEGDDVAIPSGPVSDNAGNTNSGIDSEVFKIDLTNPTGVAVVGGPGSGASYLFGSVPAAPSCTASDAVSGLANCVVTGYSTGVGTHVLIATATDNAGRTTSISRNYSVDPWTLRGFYAPVDMNGVWNSVKGGATVPLKFEVFAGQTELTDIAAIQGFTVKGAACPGLLSVVDDIELTTTGGTTLRYDSAAGQFIQNWQTPKKPGACYTVTMTTPDGSAISANVKLK